MTNLTVIRNPAENALIERFPAAKTALPASGAVAALRDRAFATIRDKGLPHRRVEAYKYTDLRALMREAAPLAPEPQTVGGGAAPFLGENCVRVGFVNGWFSTARTDQSVHPCVAVARLRDALAGNNPLIEKWFGKATALGGDDPILALNAAFMADGAVIHVTKGAAIETPILLDFAVESADALALHPRILVVLDDGASATIVEHHHGPNGVATQANSLVEIIVGEGASATHIRLDETGDKSLSLSSLAARLGRNATLDSLNMALNPLAARHQVFATFAGRDAKASLRGATLARGTQHVDATLLVDHAEPGGYSRELFRAALDGESTGVFQGKIIVRQKAQKTDGRMASNALFLCDNAAMNNKPELEIFADDVQCAHGATSGALDENLLFYLLARGIPRREAEALMIASFVGETIEPVENEAIRDALTARIDAWLAERARGV